MITFKAVCQQGKSQLSIPHYQFSIQNTANWNAKGHLLQAKRPSFALQKTAFCNSLDAKVLHRWLKYGLFPLVLAFDEAHKFEHVETYFH